MDKFFITISATAETPEEAAERFSEICNSQYLDRNLRFEGDFKIVQRDEKSWTCLVVATVNKEKRSKLNAAFE